jgi:hypothetical protein
MFFPGASCGRSLSGWGACKRPRQATQRSLPQEPHRSPRRSPAHRCSAAATHLLDLRYDAVAVDVQVVHLQLVDLRQAQQQVSRHAQRDGRRRLQNRLCAHRHGSSAMTHSAFIDTARGEGASGHAHGKRTQRPHLPSLQWTSASPSASSASCPNAPPATRDRAGPSSTR